MTGIDTATTTIPRPDSAKTVDPAHLAAAAFWARCSGPDTRRLPARPGWIFQLGRVDRIGCTRGNPHIELYRGRLEERGLAASTIDRRLSTMCGFYRSAHIDGHVASNPARYVRRPQVHRRDGQRLDRRTAHR